MTDAVWIERCVACMVELDPKLEPVLAEPIAADLNARERWRSMAPEAAAQALFEVGSKPAT